LDQSKPPSIPAQAAGAYGASVKHEDLKPAQLERLAAIIGRQLRFYNRLIERMERIGFPGNDPLYMEEIMTRNGVHRFSVTLHYASCDGGLKRAGGKSG
jgi:hypothetical protein